MKRLILSFTLAFMSFAVPAQGQDVQASQPDPKTGATSVGTSKPSASKAAAEPAESEGAGIPASLIKMVEIGQKYDQFNPWDWTTANFPSAGDTLGQEKGGIREALAKKKIGVFYMYQTEFFDNLANAPMYGANGPDLNGNYHPGNKSARQWYYGQRPTYVENQMASFTYNPSSRTQFVFQVLDGITNFGDGPQYNSARIAGAYVNQSFLNKKLTISAGYVSQGWHTGGFFLAGNIAGSLLGNNAILQGVEGQASPYYVTPSINARYNVTRYGYIVTAVGSSSDPTNSKAPMSILKMPFSAHGAKADITQEFGFQRPSAPGERKLWLRLDGLYNFTHYPDFRSINPMTAKTSRTTDNNWGVATAADYQTSQPDSSLFFRGNYIGGTAQYIPPEQNVYSQYYELRDYYIGFFKNRPMDMWTLVVNHLGYSKPWVKNMSGPAWATTGSGPYAGTTFQGVPTYATGQQSYSTSYVAHIRNGIWMNNTLMYTTHPTLTPKTPNSLVYCGALTFFF